MSGLPFDLGFAEFMSKVAADWQQFILENIPLARAMAVEVREADASHVRLAAPLAPNHNDKGTGFAGSLAAVATMAGWLLAQINAQEAAPGAVTVIAESNTTYLRPVTGDFFAECHLTDPAKLQAFRDEVMAGRKGRIDLTVAVHQGETRVLHLEGRYVAWLPEPPVA